MSNVVKIRPVSVGGVDKFTVPRDYFAVIDERGHERRVFADSIERALSEAESFECLGAAEQRAPSVLRLVGSNNEQNVQTV